MASAAEMFRTNTYQKGNQGIQDGKFQYPAHLEQDVESYRAYIDLSSCVEFHYVLSFSLSTVEPSSDHDDQLTVCLECRLLCV